MPGADDLMMRIYAAIGGQGAWEGSGRGSGLPTHWRGPDAAAAAQARRETAERAAHRLVLEVECLLAQGIAGQGALAVFRRGRRTPLEG